MQDVMPDLFLVRHDPDRNMARYSLLRIRAELSGGAVPVRNWGRLGRSGQERLSWFRDAAAARGEQQVWARRKRRRGYCDR